MKHSQTLTPLHWVYQSIVNWANLADDRKKLIEIADSGDSTFFFLRGIVDTDDIHAYMGCYNDTFYMHFIPSSADVPTSFADPMLIPNQLHSCIATTTLGTRGPLLKAEAEGRISSWDNKPLRDQVLEAPDLFQLFWIPNEDFEDNTPIQVNLAINNNAPDLVLTQMNYVDSFLNTCRPIPPFKPSFIVKDFALFEKILVWNI